MRDQTLLTYDYIISKPPLDENTLTHYGVKGMKWKRHKAKKVAMARYQIPGSSQGQALIDISAKAGEYLRKKMVLDNLNNPSLAATYDGQQHYVKDPLGGDAMWNPNSAQYKIRKKISKLSEKKKKSDKK